MSAIDYDNSEKLQKPRVSRHGKKLHLGYESAHRLNVTKVYPARSLRGADIIISGYDDGLHILWRGGRPLHINSRTVTDRIDDLSGTTKVQREWNKPVSIHKREVTRPVANEDKPAYDAEDEEVDEDEPYPSFTQELKLSLGSPVLHLAVPNIPAESALESRVQVPLMFRTRIVVAVGCADGSLRLVVLPLGPPSASAKFKGRLGAQICELSPPTSSSAMARGVALTYTSKPSLSQADNQMHVDRPRQLDAQNEGLDLLVASSFSGRTELLNFYRVPIDFDPTHGGTIPPSASPFHSVTLPSASYCLRFSTSQYPSTKHAQLLLADAKGSLKVYDPLSSTARPSSRGSEAGSSLEAGAWVSAFNTPFQMPRSATSSYPGLAHRRKIVDAAWVSDARAVMVLLDRGEWGVWDIDGLFHAQAKPTAPNNFAISGFIGSADTQAPSESQKKLSLGLAPSTPNTRQQRQESLFGAPKPAPATTASRGGICATSFNGAHGVIDDSIVLWQSNEAYHISSLTSLWQRNLNSSGKDMGSLYGPGVSRIDGLDLCGEILNSVAQFPTRTTAVASGGAMAQHDFVITGEYRFVIAMATKPQLASKGLFAQAVATVPRVNAAVDQQLLNRGELDLGGMDRLLDGLDRTNGFGTKKRVGFAGY